MKTTKTILTVWLLIILTPVMAQIAGNANYLQVRSNQTLNIFIPDNNINIPYLNNTYIEVKIKGMINVKADYYVAIFNVVQAGETAAEVNRLIDARISGVVNSFKEEKGVESYVDLISFVPIYEMELVKKLFSKDTYNEIPKGFEVQKNLHIKYKDPAILNKLMAACSEFEIYNLVRVDLFSDSIEQLKLKLAAKAQKMVMEKLATKKSILKIDLNDYDKQMVDGFKVVYPVEMYKTFQAYIASNKFKSITSSSTSKMKMATTLYYKPVIDKEFDFTINPVVFVPIIQIMYEVKIQLTKKPESKDKSGKEENKVKKEYILITPTGEVKPLQL